MPFVSSMRSTHHKKRRNQRRSRRWRGGDFPSPDITPGQPIPPKKAQQALDSFHDFWNMMRGLFGTELTKETPLPQWKLMKCVIQYALISHTANTLRVTSLNQTFYTTPIQEDSNFTTFVGYQSPDQLFHRREILSGITPSGVEGKTRKFFKIPPATEMTKLADAHITFLTLCQALFPEEQLQGNIYMVCDAGAGIFGGLGKAAHAIQPATTPLLEEIVTPQTTGDSATSNPYVNHRFMFPNQGGEGVFISDANLFTGGQWQLQYEMDEWNDLTGLGFRFVIVSLVDGSRYDIVYGVRGEGQPPRVLPPGSRAAPVIYNSLGPSAATLAGCVLQRIVANQFPDPSINHTIYHNYTLGNQVTRTQMEQDLNTIMTRDQTNVAPLCGRADMVDPWNTFGRSNADSQFINIPPELWFDIKRAGDRDQVMAAYRLQQAYPNLLIVFVTGDELCGKMAVEKGLATIYQAAGKIRYWPKNAIYQPPGPEPDPAYRIHRPETEIEQWGGMKGGLYTDITYGDNGVEDEGIEGIQNISRISGDVTITSPNGTFIIPSIHNIDYDIEFMSKRFVKCIMIYYYPEFYLNEQALFPPLSFLNTILLTHQQIRNQPFLIIYGIRPISIYILKKYGQDRSQLIYSFIVSQIDIEFQTLFQTVQHMIENQPLEPSESALTPTLPPRPSRNPKQVLSAEKHRKNRLDTYLENIQKKRSNLHTHRRAKTSPLIEPPENESPTNNFTTAAAKIRRGNREAQERQLEVGRGGKRKNKTKKRSKSKPHSS